MMDLDSASIVMLCMRWAKIAAEPNGNSLDIRSVRVATQPSSRSERDPRAQSAGMR
jgi:hypothetical protein